MKHQRKNLEPQLLKLKVEILKNKVLHKYEIESICLIIITFRLNGRVPKYV